MRISSVLYTLLTAGLFSGTRATAQEPDRQPLLPPRDPMEQRMEDAHERIMQVMMNRRARLGIKVNLQARETDSIGAYVESVTPGGPAAKAGLKSGDIITKLDGKSVLSGGT